MRQGEEHEQGMMNESGNEDTSKVIERTRVSKRAKALSEPYEKTRAEAANESPD